MEENHVIQRTPRRPKMTVINLAKVGCYKLKPKKGFFKTLFFLGALKRAPKETDLKFYPSTCSKRMPNIDVVMEGNMSDRSLFA